MNIPERPTNEDFNNFLQIATGDKKDPFITLSMAFATIYESVSVGECKDCICDTCQSIRGIMVGIDGLMRE